jgi:hypothetical protein
MNIFIKLIFILFYINKISGLVCYPTCSSSNSQYKVYLCFEDKTSDEYKSSILCIRKSTFYGIIGTTITFTTTVILPFYFLF